MRKKVGFGLGVMALTALLSSCFALQSFAILDYTLTSGQSTKARFTLRPMSPDFKVAARQFVIIGVGAVLDGQDSDIAVSNARWGTTGTFGGPESMGIENNLITAMGTDCQASGLNFADITGVTWKAFATSTNKNDQGRVEVKAVIDVSLKAKAAAFVPGESYSVMGVAGAWFDDGDGNPEDSGSTDDSYLCWGIATASVHSKA